MQGIIRPACKRLTVLTLVFLFVFSSPGLLLATEEIIETTSESPVEESTQTFNDDSNDSAVESDQEEITGLGTEVESKDSPEMLLSGEEGDLYEPGKEIVKSRFRTETDEVTGALNLIYPLVLPPGRSGFNPDLKLTYNNQDKGNFGLFGDGWSANIPYISRINRRGSDKMYTDDYYYSSLDGELKLLTAESEEEQMSVFSGTGEGIEEFMFAEDRTYLVDSGEAYFDTDGTVKYYNPVELGDERTANSVTHLLGYAKNGNKLKQSRFYSGQVNFLNPLSDNFELIDTTLKDKLDHWSMERAPYQARLNKHVSDKTITFNNQGQELYFSPLDIPEEKITGDETVIDDIWPNKQVVYRDALGQGIDLAVSLDNEALIKEAVIQNLKSLGDMTEREFYEISFLMTSNRNIDIKIGDTFLSETGSMVSGAMAQIIDDQGIVSYIRPPKAEDNSDSKDAIKIAIEYKKTDQGVLVIKKIPVTWLGNAVFPVRTDATVSNYSGSGDGYVNTSAYATTWDQAHNTTYGGFFDYSAYYTMISSNPTRIHRSFMPINTAGLPDNALINSATLYAYQASITNEDNDGQDYIALVQTTQTYTHALRPEDIVNCGAVHDPITGGQKDMGDFLAGSYNAINLNAEGLSWINRSSYTMLGLREGHDIEDIAVAGANNWLIYTTDNPGTAQDPYLEVNYEEDVVEQPTSPTGMHTEGQTNPVNVFDTQPEFSAIFNDGDQGDFAKEYQIQVSTSSTNWTSLIWNSGQIDLISTTSAGNRCEEISYGGSPLGQDGSTYYWRIKFWDSYNLEGAWSTTTASFRMANTPAMPSALLTEGQTDPSDIATTNPNFSAVFNDEDAGDKAYYYRVQIAESTTGWDSSVWDSGKTALTASTSAGSRCEDIVYSGGADLLYDGKTYYWRIKFWDESDIEGEWSGGSDNFTMLKTFAAKIENGSFNEYTSFSNGIWEVADKDGLVYTFGGATSSRQDDIASSSRIYKWMLSEVRDRNDNYIKYEYYKDSGQIYPDKITYTGHDTTDGIFEIEFLREARSDDAARYEAGFSVETKYRISEIRAKINGVWAKKYELDYSVGDNGIKSLLSRITETGQDEQSNSITLPDEEFGYQAKTDDWEEDANYTVPEYFSKQYGGGSLTGDVNGDGLEDIIFAQSGSARKVYVNIGHGSGWAYDSNYIVPVDLTQVGGDSGARLADVNGDGLVDIIASHYHSGGSGWWEIKTVYTNKGDGTGWEVDENYNIPLYFVTYEYAYAHDTGVRLADVNGDGLVDMVKFGQDIYPSISGTYLNKGDGTGWELTDNFVVPIQILDIYSHKDNGVRFADINGDGLADVLFGNDEFAHAIYINTGTGWVQDANYSLPVNFEWDRGDDAGTRIADINGDGLADLVHKGFYSAGVYINIGDGTGWTLDNNYSVPLPFSIIVEGYGEQDNGLRLFDVDGDNLPDFVYSRYEDSGNKAVYINRGKGADSLTESKTSAGGQTRIDYKFSAQYLNASNQLLNLNSPFNFETVRAIAVNDGFGNISTTTYEYAGGDYYYNDEYDRRFAGFEKITATNDLGHKTINYYHQGNTSSSTIGEYEDDQSKIGRIYRKEAYGASGNLYSKSISKWENYDLGNERDFVYLTQSLEQSYDGDVDHRDKATSYRYDDANGNLVQKTFWGEVSGSDNGTFTDTGYDLASTTISYAASTTLHLVGLPASETMFDQSGNKVQESKYYYDNLGAGEISKGNLTKQEMWKSGGDYIDIEKTYNSYGLVTQEKDPRDKTTNYVYDAINLYVATSTNAENHITQYYYDYSAGKPKKIIDPNSRVFETVYDALDRVKQEKQPDIDTPATLVVRTEYAYDDVNFPRSIKRTDFLNAATSTETYTYLDGFDRVVQERREAEEAGVFAAKDFAYNELGLLEKESLPYFSNGASSTAATSTGYLYVNYSYDPLGRVLTTVNAVGTTTNAYDQWAVTVTDAENNTKTLYKDAYGNLVRVDERNGAETYVTEYDYDLLGNLAQIEDALDNVRNFTYDGLSRLMKSEDLHAPADNQFASTTFAYDNAGNLTRKIDGKGQVTDYAYDDINRVLTEDFTGQGGTEVSYAYDSCAEGVGRLCVATTSAVVSRYDYNALGLISADNKTISGSIYGTGYYYDRQGNQTLIVYPDGTRVGYEYNTAGLLETVGKKENGEQFFSEVINGYEYNPVGQTMEQSLSNNVTSIYTYDSTELYRLKNKTTSLNELDEEDQLTMASAGTDKFTIASSKAIPIAEQYITTGLAYESADGSIKLFEPEEKANKRSRNSKTWLIGWDKEGKEAYKSRYYGGELNYFNNQTGQYEEIDTTIIDKTDHWEMNKAAYSAKIEKNLKDKFVTFENQGQELYFSLSGYPKKKIKADKTLNNSDWKNKQVVYEDALGQGIDLEVGLDNESLEKYAIINSLDSLGDFTNKDYFEINFVLTSNRKVDIKAGDKLLSEVGMITTGDPVEIIDDLGITSYIWSPKAEDNSKENNNTIGIQIEYRVLDNGISLTKKLPSNWLSNATYPVRTDTIVSYYSSAGNNFPVDGGTVYDWNGVTSWSSMRSGPGEYAEPNATESFIAVVQAGNASGWWRRLSRGLFEFNTSNIGSSPTIQTATLNVYGTTKSNSVASSLVVTAGTLGSSGYLDSWDYQRNVNNTTKFSNEIPFSSFTTYGYNTFTLNNNGINFINKTGATVFCIKTSHDADNIEPTWPSIYAWGYGKGRFADYNGTANDPYLEIEYVVNVAPSAPADLLTENQTNPELIADATPEFSAIYNDPDANDLALFYRVQVATSSVGWENSVWDSGKSEMATTSQGDRSPDISYNGNSLAYDGSVYYWRIKFWDMNDNEGDWSTTTASFTMIAVSETPSSLLTEGRENPNDVNDLTPEFSAVYNDQIFGDLAIYYQLQVSTSSYNWDNLMWDSGKTGMATTTAGERCTDITYDGKILTFDGSTFYWRLKFWDDEDNEGNWSTTTAYFSMADIQDLSYFYDSAGNITRIVNSSTQDSAKTVDFEYDDLYRLTRASSTNAVNGQDYLRTYGYNAIGNITNKSDIGNYSYADSGYSNPHAATNINGATYAYDNNGNLASDGTWTHTWDYNNRLIGSTNGSTTISYGYDHTGARVLMDNGTEAYHYPNRYYNISGATSTKHVFANNELVATIEGNGATSTIYYIHTDHLGGSSVITDQEGNVVQLLDYYPYGGIRINETPGNIDEKRKAFGHEYDDDSELYYMVARYQNPATGKFLSVDPIAQNNPAAFLADPQQLNTYSYSRNNPLRFIDPTGLYNTETGEVEDGDTQEIIVNAINETFGINTDWQTVYDVSFYEDRFGDQTLDQIVGQSLRIGTNMTTDITQKLDGLNQDMANIASALGPLSLLKFRPGGSWDLKNGQDAILGLGSDGERNYWSYIYGGNLIRYDAPGNISYGYVARSTGLSDWTVQTGAAVVQAIDDRSWNIRDNSGDSKYVQQGIDKYNSQRSWWQKLLNW